jgi:hypothetical protein
MMLPSTNRPSGAGALRGALLGGLACWATPLCADEAHAPAVGRLEAVVVTAKKRADPVADEELTRKIATALHADPYFYDEHVTVTVTNGVVRLQGMVFDDWDLRIAMRDSRGIPGVKRVINELEIKLGGE